MNITHFLDHFTVLIFPIWHFHFDLCVFRSVRHIYTMRDKLLTVLIFMQCIIIRQYIALLLKVINLPYFTKFNYLCLWSAEPSEVNNVVSGQKNFGDPGLEWKMCTRHQRELFPVSISPHWIFGCPLRASHSLLRCQHLRAFCVPRNLWVHTASIVFSQWNGKLHKSMFLSIPAEAQEKLASSYQDPIVFSVGLLQSQLVYF